MLPVETTTAGACCSQVSFLPAAIVLFAGLAATSAGGDCGAEAACNSEDVIMSCLNVTKGSSSSHACYCHERQPRPCFDVCKPGAPPGLCAQVCRDSPCSGTSSQLPGTSGQLPATARPSVDHPQSGLQLQLGPWETAVISGAAILAIGVIIVPTVVVTVRRRRRHHQPPADNLPCEAENEMQPLSNEARRGEGSEDRNADPASLRDDVEAALRAQP